MSEKQRFEWILTRLVLALEAKEATVSASSATYPMTQGRTDSTSQKEVRLENAQ